MYGVFLTGFDELDELTGGFKPGELVLVGSRPGMGKSAFAYSVMDNAFRSGDRGFALFALESTENLVMKRLMELQMLKYGEDTADARTRALTDIYSLPLMIECHSKTFADIRNKILGGSKFGRPLVIIDYLQLIECEGSEEESYVQMLSKLKEFASNMNLPVLVLSQLSRETESRKEHRPKLSDVRMDSESLALFDKVLFPYRHFYYHDDDSEMQNFAEVDVAKNTDGKTGVVILGYDYDHARFHDISEDERERYRRKERG